MKANYSGSAGIGFIFKAMGTVLLGLAAFCMGFFKSTKRSSY